MSGPRHPGLWDLERAARESEREIEHILEAILRGELRAYRFIVGEWHIFEHEFWHWHHHCPRPPRRPHHVRLSES